MKKSVISLLSSSRGRFLAIGRRIASVFLVAAAAYSASAATITVNSLADTQANDGACTLREAMTNANADNQSGSVDSAAGSGADTIDISVPGTISAVTVLPSIVSDMTINGLGSSQTIVRRDSPTNFFRIFFKQSGTATISNLAIENGFAPPSGNGQAPGGGLISVAGPLTLSGVIVRNNFAQAVTGPGGAGASAYGGGIAMIGGSLTIINSTITSNTVIGGNGSASSGQSIGGGIYLQDAGAVTITNSVVSGNVVQTLDHPTAVGAGFGGGIGANGATTLSINSGSQIINNSVTAGNGIGTGNVFGGVALGGGIHAGTGVILSITGSAVNSNTLTGGASQNYIAGQEYGGGISSSAALTITSSTVNSNTIIGGNSQTSSGSYAEGGGIYATGSVSIQSSTIRSNTVTSGGSGGAGNSGAAYGGGISCLAALTINDTDIELNTLTAGSGINGVGVWGGGIYTSGSGTKTITNSRIKSNGINGVNATSSGGGISKSSTANMTIAGSEVSNNTATDLRGTGYGGGIRNSSTMTITDSTIAGNTGLNGGGILNEGTLNLLRSTISGNTADGPGNSSGGVDSSGTVNATNSTFSNNSAPHCADVGAQGNCGGAFWSQGTVNLTNSTLTNNQTTGVNSAGGIYRYNGTVNVRNTIVGGNAAGFPDVFNRAAGTTGSGFVSQGYNLIGNVGAVTAFTQTGDQTGTSATPLDPMLGALMNNAGPTFTHQPLVGSPAVDKGAAATDPITNTPVNIDQRSFIRTDNPGVPNAPGGNGSDIGSTEHDAGPLQLTVTKTADTDDGGCDSDCSLREAMAVAGSDGFIDVIKFDIPADSPGCVGNDCIVTLSGAILPGADGGRLTTIDGDLGANTITLSGGGSAAQILDINNGVNVLANGLNFTGTTGSNGNATVTVLSGGTMTITNSALFGNSNNSPGGALKCLAGCALNLTNVTISGNQSSNGGGIYNLGAVTASNVTFTGNTGGFGGGGVSSFGTTFIIRNTIIAGNSSVIANNTDAAGTFVSQGYNLIGNGDGSTGFTATGDQKGTGGAPLNPLLGTLASNGGKTRTHILLTNSPALDKGNSFGVTTDQRGFARIYDDPLITNASGGDGADIGSVEVAPGVVTGTITYGNAIGNPAGPRFLRNVSVASTAGSPAVGPVITGTPGTYTLTGFGSGSYTIRPTKPGGSNGAITSNDAARVAQGVSGAVPFVSQNQIFAADASGNGAVTSNDAALIARFAAGLVGAGNSGQWRFFVTGAPSPLPTPPQSYNDSRSYASVSGNLTGEDFVGILVGEVTGNYNPATHPRPAGKVESGKWKVESEDRRAAEKPITVTAQPVMTGLDKEIVVPVSVEGVTGKDIISYEFNLRYDPAVIQPHENPVDVAGTVSRGLRVVTNPYEPGLLRVVVYGPIPIDEDGVLLNLRFTAVGISGLMSPLTFERIMFNDGDPGAMVTDGRVEVSARSE